MLNSSMLEHSAAQSIVPIIKSALLVSGIKCKLLKANELTDHKDEVYGIYSGNKSIEEAVNVREELISPYGKMTLDSIEQDDGEEYVEVVEDAFQFEEELMEVEDAELNDAIDVVVLMSGRSWRVGSNGEYGYYDEDSYLWSDGSVQIDHGDVLMINKPNGGNIRFKVTFIETVGMMTNIVQRFKVVNLG